MSPAESRQLDAPVSDKYPLAYYIHTQKRFELSVWVSHFDYADVLETPLERGIADHRPQNQVAVIDICGDYATWCLSRTCADYRKSAAPSNGRVNGSVRATRIDYRANPLNWRIDTASGKLRRGSRNTQFNYGADRLNLDVDAGHTNGSSRSGS